MWYVYNKAMRYVSSFGTQEWLLLLIAVVIVGAICLRGFGSRSNY